MSVFDKKIGGVATILFILLICIFTNPTKEQYIEYQRETFGEPFVENEYLKIEVIDFYIFSTFTPLVLDQHHGTVTLGVLGKIL
ncbi:hypothetical protein ACFSCX_16505 [Bacillus salitolerans]|uniref:Uncharacterized protein n=1 Tax=Bacillus salitolerans TaxID=1437434 RepID=A0ABW4LVI0_9BACI